MVGAVLVHDRKLLDALGHRAALGDVDDAGIEVAALAGQAGVDGVGDLVRDAPPDLVVAAIDEAVELLLGKGVPQPEAHLQAAVGLTFDQPGHQGLGVDRAPVAEAREQADVLGPLDEGVLVDRLEQARALEIGGDDLGDVGAHRAVAARTDERGHRDRQRVGRTRRDVDLELGACRCGSQHEQAEDQGEKAGAEGQQWLHGGQVLNIWLGSKFTIMLRQRSYWSSGRPRKGWSRK